MDARSMASRRGNCNFRNLDSNALCGCQEYVEEEDGSQTGPNSSTSSGRARKIKCWCGHFVNYHTLVQQEPPSVSRRENVDASFRSSRRISRSGATTPTSVAALSASKPTPAVDGIDNDDEFNGSKTFEDRYPYYPNQPHFPPGTLKDLQTSELNKPSFGSNGLGISVRTNRDADRQYGERSGDSSAVTEIASNLDYGPGRIHSIANNEILREQHGHQRGSILRSARSSPSLFHQRMQQLTSYYRPDDITLASTVADSPLLADAGAWGIYEIASLTNDTLGAFSRRLQQESKPNINSTSIAARDLKSPLISDREDKQFREKLQRKVLAAQFQISDILQDIEADRLGKGEGEAVEEGPSNRFEELPQSIPPDTPQCEKQTKSSSSGKATSSPLPPASSPPETKNGEHVATSEDGVVLPKPISESFLDRKLTDLNDKIDIHDEFINGQETFKETTENEIQDLNSNYITLEDRVEELKIEVARLRDEQSFRKRSHEDADGSDSDEIERRRRKSVKRRRHAHSTPDLPPSSVEKNYVRSIERGSQINPNGTIKQTLTTTTSFTHSTSTSFTSASSTDSTRRKRDHVVMSLVGLVHSLAARVAAIEMRVPTPEHPWLVQVVVLPPSTWNVWKFKEGSLVLSHTGPRAPPVGSKAWKRLKSRGLIKNLEIPGGEARDVERAIRKAFGSTLRLLLELSDSPGKEEGLTEWSPLRKVAEQNTLRFLPLGEMDKQFWKANFLQGTCSEFLSVSPNGSTIPSSDSLVGPVDSPQFLVKGKHNLNAESSGSAATHRLFITNCSTTGMGGAVWDVTRDNTQVSSANTNSNSRKRRAGSVLSTQRSSLGTAMTRRKSKQWDGRSSLSPKLGSDGDSHSGWNDIKTLPKVPVFIHEDRYDMEKKAKIMEEEYFWLYDEILDGPKEDEESPPIVDGPAPKKHADPFLDDLHVVKPVRRSMRHKKPVSSQRSQPVTSQPKVVELKGPSDTRRGSVPSQTSFTGFSVPSFSRNSSRNTGDVLDPNGHLSFGMISHDSDSTPKARSFLAATPPPNAALNPKLLHSRLERVKEALEASPQRASSSVQASNKASVDDRDSTSSAHEDGADEWSEKRRHSRSPTVEDDPPASLLTNPHNSNETNAELMAKYGYDSSTFNKCLDPITSQTFRNESQERSGLKETKV